MFKQTFTISGKKLMSDLTNAAKEVRKAVKTMKDIASKDYELTISLKEKKEEKQNAKQ